MSLSGAHPAFFGSLALSIGSRPNTQWQMTSEEACDYLDRVGEYRRGVPSGERSGLPGTIGLCVSGAEPFAQVDDLEILLECAARNNMMTEVVSTVFWVDSDATADRVLERFRKRLHVLTVLTSRGEVDRFGIAALDRLLLAARRHHLTFQIAIAVSPSEPFPKELLGLEVVNCDTSVMRVEPVLEEPRQGSVEWPQGYLLDAPPRYGRCAEMMGLVIVPGGDVYPCSSGIGFPQLRLGNLQKQTVREIVSEAMARTDLERLRNQGPFFLFEDWRSSDRPAPLAGGFLSSCDFHRRLLAHTAPAGIRAETATA